MALAAGLLWQGAGVAVPFALGHALDDGVLPGNTRVLLGWCGGILLLGALRWGGGWYRHWWIDRAGIRAAVFVRRRLLARTVDLDETTAGRLGQGQLIARATSDVDIVDGWVRGLATLVTATFTLIAVGIALIALGSQPALVGAAAVPLTIALTARHIRRQRVAAAALAESGGTLTGMVEELIGGAATVKGLRAEPIMAARTGTASRQLREAAMAVERVEASWLAAASLVPGLAVAAGVWLIGEMVLDGDLAPGDLVAFVGWMALLVRAVETLTERLITRGAARAAADRLVAVLNAPPAVAEAPDPRPLPPGGAVSVRGVHAVRGGRAVLHDIDLEIPAGQWVGLIGPTGSGKTSLLRLLPRLGDPAAGELRVAGELIGTVALTELRARVGYLGQRGVLLAGTLAENLRLTAPDAGDDDLCAALAATAALDLLDVVPGGLAGRIGVGGATLSGGQRQRLCLARTVLARPDVLVLDDPTAALDPGTEERLLMGLREFLPAATLICATHRVAMARAMDRLVVLADGRIRADGEPAEVLAAGAAGALVLDLAGAR